MNNPRVEKSIVQVARQDKTVYVQVIGRGSFQNASHVKNFCEETIRGGGEDFIVDLRECSYLDSTFLGTLAGVGLKLRSSGKGSLQVVNASARNTELIQNLGLDRLFRFQLQSVDLPAVAPLGGRPADKAETGATMLEAHETLMRVDERNVPKFKDVVAYLKEDLGQKVG